MPWTEAQVPLLDPETDKFPDRFAPPSVAADKIAAAGSASAASGSAAAASAAAALVSEGAASGSAAAALVSENNAAATLAGAITKAGTAGFPARDGSGATNSRTITAGTGVTVTNGDGVSGNPTVAVTAGTYAPQAGLYLSGVATDYVSAPDADTLDITGDIEVIWRGAMINWTDATAVKPLISKWDTAGNQRGWHFWLASGATPTPTLTWSPNGTDLLAASCTAAITGVVTNGVPLWLRVTLDVDNGAGGRTAQFHRSADGVTWTKIGSDVTVAAVTNIYAGTAPLRVGLTATSAIAAIHQRAIVKNGIGGTTVADWDGRIPHTRQRDAAGNIWTINGTANAWQVI